MSAVSSAARAKAHRMLRARRALAAQVLAVGGGRIAPETTFLEWVEGLGDSGLKVDGQPFDLTSRPALREIYAAVPTTKAEGYDLLFAIMKGAQTGATVMTFLLQLYLMLKYEPLKVGTYYPNRSLAAYVSSSRFLPVVRSVPQAHRAMLSANDGGEGNVLNRLIGSSEVLFLWTSGSSVTESFPLGAIVADEVQNMLVDDIERIRERMSASDVRFFFACSTAKWPGADIDALYQRGDQRRFHTQCRCDDGVLLDEVFPQCIEYNDGQYDAEGAPRDYVYVCPACKTYIPDSQRGEWRKHAPQNRHVSYHLPQTLSPTVSPREILEAYRTAEDLQNFFNRKLGKPWTDPSQVPITLAICERQVEAGRRAGVVWKERASGTFMGLDQMGNFIVAIVIERMADGRQALIHAEFIYGADTWERASELMDQYGVQTCVVEQLPNVDSARKFANRHLGRVFLAGYADLRDDMMVWSDQASRSDRKTIEDDRSRYTVSLNQYKVMQTALFRIRDGYTLFPDPKDKVQDIRAKGETIRKPVLQEVFFHFTKTALVVKRHETERRVQARVEKIAIDPHASYAFMLANVAWSRAFGTGMVIMPASVPPASAVEPIVSVISQALPGMVPSAVKQAVAEAEAMARAGTCGACGAFDRAAGRCTERGFNTTPNEPACPFYLPL